MSNSKLVSQPKQSDESEATDRRALMTALLAGVGLTTLQGCIAPGVDTDTLGEATDALTGTAAWIDTVVGVSSSLRTTIGTTVGQTVLIACYAYAADGGGGPFVWTDDTVPPDDGGLTIVPSFGGGSRTGCWKRLYSGPISILWFGARRDSVTTSHVEIQAAIDAAASMGNTSGEVYIPRGEYFIAETLVIPRLDSWSGFSIRGEGAGVSVLMAKDSLAETSPMMVFDGASAQVDFFRLEGLALKRTTKGAVFNFQGTDSYRMNLSVFRDLLFYSPDPNSGPYTQQAVLRLVHCHDTTFDDVTVQGGEDGLLLIDSSRCNFTRFNVNRFSGTSANGVVIIGGGTHTFRALRIEAPGGAGANVHGYGLFIMGSSNLVFDTLGFENHGAMVEQIAIRCDPAGAVSQNILFMNTSIAKGAKPGDLNFGTTGIRIYENVRGVRFVGGTLTEQWHGAPTVRIDDGASDIFFDGCAFTGDPQGLISIGNVRRVRLNLRWIGADYGSAGDNVGTGYHAIEIARGMIGTLVLSTTGSCAVRGYQVWKASASESGMITHLTEGADGQVVTLLVHGNVTVSNTGSGNDSLLLNGGAAFTPSGSDGAIRLVYDRGDRIWRELSRSDNS